MPISRTTRAAATARLGLIAMAAAFAFGAQAQSLLETATTQLQAVASPPEVVTTQAEPVAPQSQTVPAPSEVAAPPMAIPQAVAPQAATPQVLAEASQPPAVIVQPEPVASQSQPAALLPQTMASRAQLMSPKTVGDVTYICGGAGVEEHDQLTNLEPQYNLGVIFTEGPRGAFLEGVVVRLRRHGRVLAAFKATGPRCLFKLPPADYRVEASYKDRMQYVIVETGSMGAGMRW